MDIAVMVPRNISVNYIHSWLLLNTPKKLEVNERVYFVVGHEITFSMKVVEKNQTIKSLSSNTTIKGCELLLTDRRPEQLDLDIRAFRGFRYMEGIYKEQERLDVFDIEELMGKRRPTYERRGGALRQR